MKFKAKLRKVGNSTVVTIPAHILADFVPGEEIELEVVGSEQDKQQKIVYEPVKGKDDSLEVITEKPSTRMEMCPKHPGSRKITCGCK